MESEDHGAGRLQRLDLVFILVVRPRSNVLRSVRSIDAGCYARFCIPNAQMFIVACLPDPPSTNLQNI